MDWQEATALGIVGITAGLFAWNRFKPRKFSLERDTHCGCSSPSQTVPQNSIVFRARRGERPRIEVKMK